mgnify:CR=1 FL=1
MPMGMTNQTVFATSDLFLNKVGYIYICIIKTRWHIISQYTTFTCIYCVIECSLLCCYCYNSLDILQCECAHIIDHFHGKLI